MTDMEPIVVYLDGTWDFENDQLPDESRDYMVINSATTVGDFIDFVGREQAETILEEYRSS